MEGDEGRDACLGEGCDGDQWFEVVADGAARIALVRDPAAAGDDPRAVSQRRARLVDPDL